MKRMYLILIMLIIVIIFMLGVKVGSRKESSNNEFQKVSISSDISEKEIKEVEQKLNLKEIIVDGFAKKSELITSEVSLFQEIVWDESWGDWDMLKKSQTIGFYGKGIYIVDLSKITDEDIIVEPSDNTLITVKLDKPKVKSIEILNNKTSYTYEKGLFRFGNIEMTMQQSQLIEQEVKDKMLEEMKSEPLYNASLETARESVRDLFKSILSKANGVNYIVSVEWKE